MRRERRYQDAPTETRTCTGCGSRFETAVNDPYNTCSTDCDQPRPAAPVMSSRPVYLPAEAVKAMIGATKGATFAVEFVKKNSERRLMYAQTGAYSNVPRPGRVIVWDVEHSGFRSIPLDRVFSFAICTETKITEPVLPPAYQIPTTNATSADPFAGF